MLSSMYTERAESQDPTALSSIPAVPLTIEGSAVLHQMFRFRWTAWRAASPDLRRRALQEAASAIQPMEQQAEKGSALYSLLGHKGDLMLVHFRPGFEDLNRAELLLARLGLAEFLEPSTSYLSVVELGLYDSSLRVYGALAQRGVSEGSEEWEKEVREALAQHRKAMAPRLYPSIPPARYICFYPMSRKRDASGNWYRLPIAKRRDLMREHGEIGRKYAGEVKQVVTGSIGFDDWEWGVDLFSDNPIAFKNLIYEMRFDEASALYAEFGPFYVGLRLPVAGLSGFLEGRLPSEGEVLGG